MLVYALKNYLDQIFVKFWAEIFLSDHVTFKLRYNQI